MRNHAFFENNIWDEGQLGGVQGVLGTVDQFLIDVCIIEEVKEHHRNLAVAYNDYRKAYDKVHYDWMVRDGDTCECHLVVAGVDEKVEDQTRDME